MMMTTIPRRYIYEVLLEFEDVVLELQSMIFNEEYYDKYIDLFNEKQIIVLKSSFREIIATLPLFLDNLKFETQEEMRSEIDFYLLNMSDAEKIIKKNKNISKKNKALINELDEIIVNLEKIKSYDEAKYIFDLMDKFDTLIPRTLELRRDHMK